MVAARVNTDGKGTIDQLKSGEDIRRMQNGTSSYRVIAKEKGEDSEFMGVDAKPSKAKEDGSHLQNAFQNEEENDKKQDSTTGLEATVDDTKVSAHQYHFQLLLISEIFYSQRNFPWA